MLIELSLKYYIIVISNLQDVFVSTIWFWFTELHVTTC